MSFENNMYHKQLNSVADQPMAIDALEATVNRAVDTGYRVSQTESGEYTVNAVTLPRLVGAEAYPAVYNTDLIRCVGDERTPCITQVSLAAYNKDIQYKEQVPSMFFKYLMKSLPDEMIISAEFGDQTVPVGIKLTHLLDAATLVENAATKTDKDGNYPDGVVFVQPRYKKRMVDFMRETLSPAEPKLAEPQYTPAEPEDQLLPFETDLPVVDVSNSAKATEFVKKHGIKMEAACAWLATIGLAAGFSGVGTSLYFSGESLLRQHDISVMESAKQNIQYDLPEASGTTLSNVDGQITEANYEIDDANTANVRSVIVAVSGLALFLNASGIEAYLARRRRA